MKTDITAFHETTNTAMNESPLGMSPRPRSCTWLEQSPVSLLTLDKHPAGRLSDFCALPFSGRREDLWRLFDFMKFPTEIQWWAITGPSGPDRSRLAYELMDRMSPESYGFFLNCDADISSLDDFHPSQDLLVVIDPVTGHEAAAAGFIATLMDKFEESIYFLRILLLEQCSPLPGDSWYDRLEQSFDAEHRSLFRSTEYDPSLCTLRGHNFLRLDQPDRIPESSTGGQPEMNRGGTVGQLGTDGGGTDGQPGTEDGGTDGQHGTEDGGTDGRDLNDAVTHLSLLADITSPEMVPELLPPTWQVDLVNAELDFWKSFPTESEQAHLLKLRGLYYCSRKLVCWYPDASSWEALELLCDFPESDGIISYKIAFLLDHAAYFTDSLHDGKRSAQLVRQVRPLLDRLPQGDTQVKLRLRWYREHSMNLILQERWSAALKLKDEIFPLVDWEDEVQVEYYAYWAFSCTMGAAYAQEAEKTLDFGALLIELTEDYAHAMRTIAFSDRTHYYYLHTRCIVLKFVSISASITGQNSFGVSRVEDLIEEISSNMMNGDLAGLLVGAWALKTEFDEMLSKKEMNSYLEETDEYLEQYPDHPFLAQYAIGLWVAAYEAFFQKNAPAERVTRAYAMLQRFPHHREIIDNFFRLLGHSNERDNWDYYVSDEKLRQLLALYKRDYLLTPAAVSVAAADEPFVRMEKKVYPNDPCPCGSGKKYKKCCGRK